MPRLSEKQKRDKARARGEEVFEPMNGATVKAMFNLIRNLYGNPHNLGTDTRPFTSEYDWKQLQATATLSDYGELLKELAKTDERAYNKLYKLDPSIGLTFQQYKSDNPPSPAKIAELKAKYDPKIYLITDDERKYVSGGHSEERKLADQAFRARSEAYFSQVSSAGPPAEAVALSTKSATQAAGGEPPRALPKDGDVLSRVSSDVLSTPSRERPKFGSVMVKALETGGELPDIKALLRLSDEDYLALIQKRQKLVDDEMKRVKPGVSYRAKNGPPTAPIGLEYLLYPEAKFEADKEMLRERSDKIFYKLRDERFAREREERRGKPTQIIKPVDALALAQKRKANTEYFSKLPLRAQQSLKERYATSPDWLANLDFATMSAAENMFSR